MHRNLLTWSLSLVATFAFAAPSPPVRILPLGDSITLGACPGGGYRLGLYRLLTNAGYNVDFLGTQTNSPECSLPDSHHEGHSGWRINQIGSIISTVFAQIEDPDVILLLLGTNDYGAGQDLPTAIDRLEALIAKMALSRPHAQIIVANLLVRGEPQNSQIQRTFNPLVPGVVGRQAALGRHVYFTDMRSAVSLTDMPDMLHPNARGYAKMATNWFSAITNLISPLGTTNAPELVRAISAPGRTNVVVTFSKPLSDESASTAHYSLNEGASVLRVSLDGVSKRVITLVTTALRPGADYILTVNGVSDRTAARRTIVPNSTIRFIAAPVRGVLTNAPESATYEKVYELNIPPASDWTTIPVPYTVDRHREIGRFSRVAYYLELQKAGSPLEFLWASMDAFTDDPGKLGVPTLSSGAFFQQPVSNLTVRSSVPGIANRDKRMGGFLEFWPYNYSPINALNVPNASDTDFDWGDNPAAGGMYGSMQLHDINACQVLFAFNNWGDGGGDNDLGIGNNTGSANADWTFMLNANRYTVRHLQVFVQTVPSLGIRRVTADMLEIFWPSSGTDGFVIETTDRLPATSWTVISANAVTTNSLRTVRMPMNSPCRFFRLRKR